MPVLYAPYGYYISHLDDQRLKACFLVFSNVVENVLQWEWCLKCVNNCKPLKIIALTGLEPAPLSSGVERVTTTPQDVWRAERQTPTRLAIAPQKTKVWQWHWKSNNGNTLEINRPNIYHVIPLWWSSSGVRQPDLASTSSFWLYQSLEHA